MTPASRFSSRREFLAAAGTATAGLGLIASAGTAGVVFSAPPAQPGQQRVFGLKHPPLDTVRIGFIGVGGRGSSLLGNLLALDGVEIKAVCDVVPERVKARPAARRGQGPSRSRPATRRTRPTSSSSASATTSTWCTSPRRGTGMCAWRSAP